MAALVKLVIGLAVVFLIGIASIQFDFLPGSAVTAERKLERNALTALSQQEASWAEADVSGQKITLSGTAPNKETLDKLVMALNASSGNGGLFYGGVTVVDSSAASIQSGPPPASPFLWSADYRDGVLALSGHTPDEAAQDAIMRYAKTHFPDAAITADFSLASGAPAEDDWLSAISACLTALSRLEFGTVRAIDGVFEVSGEAASEESAYVVRRLLSSVSGEVSAVSELVIAPPPEEVPPAIAEQALPQTSITPDTAETDQCRERLTDAVAGSQISFESASAAPDNNAQDELADLAAALNECPDYGLEVIGHTDSRGSAASNRALSLSRAETVGARLSALGLAEDRMSFVGAGESAPLASNMTAAGRAQNRRIELRLREPQAEGE